MSNYKAEFEESVVSVISRLYVDMYDRRHHCWNIWGGFVLFQESV